LNSFENEKPSWEGMTLDLENRRNKLFLRVTKTEEISTFKGHQPNLRLSNTLSWWKLYATQNAKLSTKMAKHQGIQYLLQKTLKVNQVRSLCKTILTTNVWLLDWFMLRNINNGWSKKFGVEEWGRKKERPKWWWWWRARKQTFLVVVVVAVAKAKPS